MKILVVEDDKTIASGLAYSLEQEGFETILAHNYKEGLANVDSTDLCLCLLDLTLPDGSGYDLCRYIKKNKDYPIIFLTACDDEVNVVMGLDMGADDYITKPFRIRELLSRIKTVLRRYGNSVVNNNLILFENIMINTAEAKVFVDNNEVILTALEYRLLLVFANNRGKVLSRNQLLEGIWDVNGDFVNDNTLTVYIKRLRDKLNDDQKEPHIIKTIRGLGYKCE